MPFVAELALQLHIAVKRIGECGRQGLAFVLAGRALVLVEAGDAPQRHDQPAAEGMLDREAYLAREDTETPGSVVSLPPSWQSA